VEHLEDRLALSGNVTVNVSGGSLLIRGDNSSNGVMITQGPGSYTYIITGFTQNGGPTTINGQASVTVGGVSENFDIQLRRGNDFLFLNGVVVPDELIVDAGDGNDRVLLRNSFASSESVIETGNGNDFLQIANTRFNNEFFADLGNGNDIFADINSVFADDVAVNGGSGFDRLLNLGGNTTLGSISVKRFESFV